MLPFPDMVQVITTTMVTKANIMAVHTAILMMIMDHIITQEIGRIKQIRNRDRGLTLP
jgi:hypothetical protein